MELIEAAINLVAVNIHLGVVLRSGKSFVVKKVTVVDV